jgi:hypothetical protein
VSIFMIVSSSAIPTAALDVDRPTIPCFILALPSPTLQAPYPLAHTSDTTSTSLRTNPDPKFFSVEMGRNLMA